MDSAEKEQMLDELYELDKDIDILRFKLDEQEIEYENNPQEITLMKINILRDNLKDKQLEYDMLSEELS